MCLLMTGKSNNIRKTLLETPGLIADIFKSNPDGLGIMYTTTRGLRVIKKLPNTIKDCEKVLARLPNDGRDVAVHWRWRTHGDVNLEQCHPYEIEKDVSMMMHNGVLHTGNKADTKKSDTWHYIEDFLKGVHQNTLHDPAFKKLVSEHIGDNRFAIMTKDGRLTVVNEDQGLYVNDIWFSNTYAWSPEILDPSYWGVSKWSNWTDMKDYGLTTHFSPFEVDTAIEDCDVDVLEESLFNFPRSTVNHICDNYMITPYSLKAALAKEDHKALMRWIHDDKEALTSHIVRCTESGTRKMAEVLQWYAKLESLPVLAANEEVMA